VSMEEQKKRRTRRKFTDEYKARAVRLVLKEGQTAAQVARDLDLIESVLHSTAPINDTLLPVLKAWLNRLGREEGLVFPPTGHGQFVISHRLRASLRTAQDALGLPHLTWCQSTRHTFASHWVTDGRPIEKLRDILGHSTVQVTERYAHLAPDAFGRADYAAGSVDLDASGDDPQKGDDNRTTMKPSGPKSGSQVPESTTGEVAEWPKAPDSKSGLGASPTWVRLPPSPPDDRHERRDRDRPRPTETRDRDRDPRGTKATNPADSDEDELCSSEEARRVWEPFEGSQVDGEVSEWPKEHDWKSCVPQGTEGSNPSLSSSVYAACSSLSFSRT
jgi:hypothetical protein